MSVVHVAGITVEAEGVLRQRCAWCGALLLECGLANISRPLEPGEDPASPQPWSPAAWEIHALVRVDDHIEAAGVRYGALVEPEAHPDSPERVKIPDDACMLLDRAVTR